MCHVYSNGSINNSKIQPKAKSTSLPALKLMFRKEGGVVF